MQPENNLPSTLPFLERVLTSAMYLLASRAMDESLRLLQTRERERKRLRLTYLSYINLSHLLPCWQSFSYCTFCSKLTEGNKGGREGVFLVLEPVIIEHLDLAFTSPLILLKLNFNGPLLVAAVCRDMVCIFLHTYISLFRLSASSTLSWRQHKLMRTA